MKKYFFVIALLFSLTFIGCDKDECPICNECECVCPSGCDKCAPGECICVK